LEYAGRKGLLLPEVPIEHRMTREQFFTTLAAKAGLPSTVYASPEAKLSVFRDQVFSG
jgi:AMMECR1 domain-containing protein